LWNKRKRFFDIMVMIICSGGGIGRHAGLKILWALARAGSIPAPSTEKIIYSGMWKMVIRSVS
jgi:hypothetical protein